MGHFAKIALLVSCLACAAGLARAGTTCPLVIAGDFPVTYIDHVTPVISVKIDGRSYRMMVDSGSDLSTVSTKTWSALGSPEFAPLYGYETGVGGIVELNTVIIEDIDTGHANARQQEMVVSDSLLAADKGELPVDGILGEDFLDNFDIAYDLPDNRITLYFRQTCDTAAAPWAGDYDVEAITFDHRHSVNLVPYEIDGETLLGIIDTGSTQTLLNSAAMGHAGIVPAAQPPKLMHMFVGAGALAFPAHREMFDNITVGAESFDHAWLWVAKAPTENDFNVLIGEDYLHTHRVFVSNSSQTVLFGLYMAKSQVEAAAN